MGMNMQTSRIECTLCTAERPCSITMWLVVPCGCVQQHVFIKLTCGCVSYYNIDGP
jgi:hypothetical protein